MDCLILTKTICPRTNSVPRTVLDHLPMLCPGTTTKEVLRPLSPFNRKENRGLEKRSLCPRSPCQKVVASGFESRSPTLSIRDGAERKARQAREAFLPVTPAPGVPMKPGCWEVAFIPSPGVPVPRWVTAASPRRAGRECWIKPAPKPGSANAHRHCVSTQ